MIGILSDLHISNSLPYSHTAEDGISDRIRDIILFFRRVRGELPPTVIVLGDIFDRRRLDAVTIKVGTKLLGNLVTSGHRVIVLPGNHDTEDAAGKHNTVQYLAEIKCHILKHGETFEIDGVTFHAFPYLATKAFVAMVKAQALADGVNVALVHQAVKGSRQGDVPFPSEIPPTLFDRFDLAIGGHVHHRQRVGKVAFVGSTWNIDFREANEVSGYHLFDPKTLDLEFVSSTMPRFHTFDREAGDFGRDDYVIVQDPETEPKGKARLLVSKRTEEREARSRLELTSERFTWEEAIAGYVKATAPEGLDTSKLTTLGLRLLGDPTTSRGLPGLVTFQSIEASDFMCFEGFTLALDTPGATLILGRNLCTAAATSNGSGKTSIFRALTWALYGRILEEKEVVRKRAKKATVKLVFEKNGDVYEIERWKSASRSDVKLTMNGEDISAEGSQKDTTAKIERLLGLDFLSFRNSVLFGQGDRMRFADPQLKDEDRKRIFRAALNIDDTIRAAQKEASAFKASKAADASKAEGELSRLDSTIAHDGARLEELTRKSYGYEEERAAKLKKLENDLAEIPDVASLNEKLERLREKHRAEIEMASGIEAASREIETIDSSIEAIEIARRDVEREVAKALAAGSGIEAELDRYKAGTCPTCGTRVETETIAAHLRGLRHDLAAIKNVKLRNLNAALAKNEEAIEEAKGRRGTLEAEVKKANLHKYNAGTMAGSLRALEMKISHLDSESARLRADIAEVRRMSNPYEEERVALSKDCDEMAATRTALASRLEASRRSVAYLDYWVHGFGNKGIGSFLIEISIPKLEAKTNRYLDTLADGDVRIRLSATKESKKGTEVEEFDVSYDIEGDTDSLPSGGQLKKIEIAIDLAFMDILAERDGAEIGLVMLDEILDGLDAEGRSRVMILVEDLRRRKGAAHVISHDAELGVVFDRVILVVRKRSSKGAVSTVTEM